MIVAVRVLKTVDIVKPRFEALPSFPGSGSAVTVGSRLSCVSMTVMVPIVKGEVFVPAIELAEV